MQAALQERYGPPDVVRVADVDRPVPKDDEVLIRVEAASVNRADLDGLGPKPGFVRLFLGLRAPRNHRMGIDVAGIVESVGAKASRFRPGDRVFADLYPHGGGAFAEYACAAEKAFQLMPADMSFEDAATLPHSAILAVQGLRRRGRTIKPGDKVAIVGASGNVGPFAVQIAKSMGAEVTGVCSTQKVDFVRVARRRPRASTTNRSITRRPASATTGSSTPTPTIRSAASVAHCAPMASTSPWAGRRCRSWRV